MADHKTREFGKQDKRRRVPDSANTNEAQENVMPTGVLPVLSLQRMIGNRAVQRLLAHDPHSAQTGRQVQRTPGTPAAEAAAAPAPAAARNGNLAGQIRALSNGITVVLSIPNAVASAQDAENLSPGSISSYAYKRSWELMAEQEASDTSIGTGVQSIWQAYRNSRADVFGEIDVEAEAETERSLRAAEAASISAMQTQSDADKLADQANTALTRKQRSQNQERRQKALRALRSGVRKQQGVRTNKANVLKTLREALRGLPADYTSANAKQKKLIQAALYENALRSVKDFLWTNHRSTVARVEYQNNAEFQSQAEAFAKSHQALGMADGQLQVGQHMTYHTKEEIPQHVNNVYNNTREALRAAPGEQANENVDELAKIKSLVLFSHGSSGWMGGHHEAESAALRTRDVAQLISGMSGALSSNVHMALFACLTASSVKGAPPNGENSLADTFAEQLAREHPDAFVTGHTTAGHAVRNSQLRTFTGSGDEGGKNIAVNRKTGDPLVTDTFITAELERLGIIEDVDNQIDRAAGNHAASLTEEQRRKKRQPLLAKFIAQMRTAMIDCYATEVAFFETLDEADSAEDLRPEFEELWTTLVQQDNAIGKALRKGRYNENWVSLRPK